MAVARTTPKEVKKTSGKIEKMESKSNPHVEEMRDKINELVDAVNK